MYTYSLQGWDRTNFCDLCTVPYCKRKHMAKGYCKKHYNKIYNDAILAQGRNHEKIQTISERL